MPGPAYRIHTPRLIIRCWQPSDAPFLEAAIKESLDHLRPWMPWVRDEPKELEDRVEWLRRARGDFDLDRDFIYGIFNSDESQVLGGTGLHTRVGEGAREIGYWIHRDYVNQGLATEAAAALTKVAFEIDEVNRVEIHCDPRNVRSAAIPRKLGFAHEATLGQRVIDADGQRRDTMIWTLFADKYATTAAASAKIEAYDAAGRRIDVTGCATLLYCA